MEFDLCKSFALFSVICERTYICILFQRLYVYEFTTEFVRGNSANAICNFGKRISSDYVCFFVQFVKLCISLFCSLVKEEYVYVFYFAVKFIYSVKFGTCYLSMNLTV